MFLRFGRCIVAHWEEGVNARKKARDVPLAFLMHGDQSAVVVEAVRRVMPQEAAFSFEAAFCGSPALFRRSTSSMTAMGAASPIR
jgi:hypothetical protein